MSLNESIVEDAALEWFGELGYAVGHGPHLAPGEPAAERDSFGEVVLVGRLREAIRRLNPAIPEEAREEALRKVLRVGTPSLTQTNRAFHRMLRDGVPVEYIQEPSPQPSPRGRGSEGHYRGGFDFAGLKKKARELRAKQTEAEGFLWGLLRDRQLGDAKFRRNHQFGDYICDFYCNEAKLVIECDGEVHNSPESQAHDRKRDAYMKSQGLTVLRFENARVLKDTDAVLAEVASHLPSTSGRGAGGEGLRRWGIVKLVDFGDVRANDWLVVNQFTVIEGQHNRRPDIVVFINGLPLGLIELKNAADEDATIWSAYAQLQTYKAEIPSLLHYNAALVVSDGLQARMGSVTANQEWFKVWRTIDGEGDAPKTALELEVLVRGVFERQRFLDLLQHFIVFEEDPDSGALHKIIAGYHQFHAVNAAVEETVRASGMAEDISILSDQFLAEIRGLKYKNVAAELLEKLLKDELKVRSKRNLVQSQVFSEKLKQTLNAYHNRAISTMQVLEELIQLAKDLDAAIKRGQDLGLTEDEVAFYDALAANQSAVIALGDDKLKVIAAELITKVRQSVTIDWTLRESARAKIKVMVKRILNKYGYPPDLQEEAVKTVLAQAELLCAEWV